MPGSESPISLNAYAKINLALQVVGKRRDGFHEVAMIMQSVSLHDTVTLSLRSTGISLVCDNPGLPCDNSNLAYRAAALLRQECGVAEGVHIELTKRIPMAAGLAGGSSDAAAVLRGLNDLWDLAIAPNELEILAARLGSDVPFCLWGGTTLATGRGEILESLPDFAGYGVVLANPPLHLSTAWVYGNFQPRTLQRTSEIPALRRAIEQKDLQAVARQLYNDLESVSVPAHPQIADIKKELASAGAAGVLMSGSGPTVFALTNDLASAHQLAGRVSLGTGVSVFMAETVAREEK
jgi:4-diphosphocytidyl-2-C-methyl-D-erythritol kinase